MTAYTDIISSTLSLPLHGIFRKKESIFQNDCSFSCDGSLNDEECLGASEVPNPIVFISKSTYHIPADDQTKNRACPSIATSTTEFQSHIPKLYVLPTIRKRF